MIIRDYLIPWFTPTLSRIRTLSVGGTGKMEPAFEDFRRLTLFTHLEKVYNDRTWVRVDGDPSGLNVIEKLKSSYKSWNQDRFKTYKHPYFEHYYPTEFSTQIEAVTNPGQVLKKENRELKKNLLLEVKAWLDQDHKRGKEALAESAREIIDDLVQIQKTLFHRST
ncbi:hypothetical protein [Fluviicoccus keumensis]|uniref:hypothetical protein n=1 Tax=Fluviicoccus keumensis TaxID=1435465 RepID=UPI00102ADD48|nr:hypothetical protein [Fluviicoccus keumensis]